MIMKEVEKIKTGDIRSATRLIRNIENDIPEAKLMIKHLFPFTGRARVVGLTGPPGAGKSTLINSLITLYRAEGKRIGAILVDPTSPFTNGAILGDRIRLQHHAEDPDVFVRSLATKGALGGLSKATGDAIRVMDAMGKDIIFVETVGTGQQEVDIMNHAHTVVVVLVPGMGDDIQAIKAGILEIADVFVINKADREKAEKLYQELTSMLSIPHSIRGQWRSPVTRVGSLFEKDVYQKNIEELSQSIEAHYRFLVKDDLFEDRVRRKLMTEFYEALHATILAPIWEQLISDGELDELLHRVMKKESDPHTCAEKVANRYLKKERIGSYRGQEIPKNP